MDIGYINGYTRVLGAPENWDHNISGPCYGLPVRDDNSGTSQS